MMMNNQDSSVLKLLTSPDIYHLFKGTPIELACKRLEEDIVDKKKTYIEKVEVFMFVLEGFISFSFITCNFSIEDISIMFQYIQRKALNLLLDGDWGKNKAASNHLTFMLSRLKEIFTAEVSEPFVRDSMEYLITLSSSPWGNPVLTKILHNKPCSDEEMLLLFGCEIGMVLLARLEKMVEAKCETQALKLIHLFLQCICHQKHFPYFESYLEDILYIEELYLILLVKKKDNISFVEEVNKMELSEGYKMVQRSLKSERSLWLKKYRNKMVKLVLNSVLMKAMFQPISNEGLLCNVINEWFNLCHKAKEFQVFNQMSLNAVSSHHIYLLCKVLVERCGGSEKRLCVELYIRALTVNLNELENLKLNDQQENVRKSEVQMSEGFISLADFLSEDITTCREAVLTAFSLNPTRECYNRLEDLAIASSRIESLNEQVDHFQSNRFPMEADINTSDFQAKEPRSHSAFLFVLNVPEVQVVGISRKLCDDLLTVIGRARYKVLSWKLDWSELRTRCESYLTSGKDTLDAEKELLYLKIDYHQFKDWPNAVNLYTDLEPIFVA